MTNVLPFNNIPTTKRYSNTFSFCFCLIIEKYCPKEVLEGKRLTIEELKSVDVYASALTAFELLTEEEPFSECRNTHEIRKAISDGEILNILARNECGISKAKKDLLTTALSQDRPSAAEFLKNFTRIIAAEI